MTGEQGMGYHEWLLLNEALEVEHPVFVINLANRSGEFQRRDYMSTACSTRAGLVTQPLLGDSSTCR